MYLLLFLLKTTNLT